MAKRSGISADEVYVSSLWCFEELSFLINTNDEMSSDSNVDLHDQSDLYFNVADVTASNSSTPMRSLSENVKKKQCKKSNGQSYGAMESYMSCNKLAATKADYFCNMLAKEMKNFTDEEIYDEFTSGVFSLLVRLKGKQRRKNHDENNPQRLSSSSSSTSAFFFDGSTSTPSPTCNIPSRKEELVHIESVTNIASPIPPGAFFFDGSTSTPSPTCNIPSRKEELVHIDSVTNIASPIPPGVFFFDGSTSPTCNIPSRMEELVAAKRNILEEAMRGMLD